MIFNFRIVSDEADKYKREISIDASATFMDLKNVICDTNGWDKNQLCSFFICDPNWNKKEEITMEDMDTDADVDVWLMEDSILGDHIDDEGQRLLFVFDYMTDRQLKIKMKKLQPGANLMDPVCTLSQGKAPEQTIDMAEFEARLNIPDAVNGKQGAAAAREDMGEEFYGSEQYDEDELDAEAFGEVSTYSEDM